MRAALDDTLQPALCRCERATCWGIGWLPSDAGAPDDDSHGNGVPPPGRRHAAERQATAGQPGSSRASQPGEAGSLPGARGRHSRAGAGVGLSDGVSLIDGCHDLDNYLFPVAQRLGPERVAAIFGRKICGPSSLAVGPAQPATAGATPQFSTRMTGSSERREWKQKLHDRLAVQAVTIDPGPVGLKIALTTGPRRNWASGSRSSMPSARC
jgi:hypothetical protein